MFDWDLPSYCSLAATHNPMELKLRMRNAVFQAFLGVRLRVSLRNSLCCEQLETLLTLTSMSQLRCDSQSHGAKAPMRNAVFQAFLGVRLRVSLRNSLCCEQLETLLTLTSMSQLRCDSQSHGAKAPMRNAVFQAFLGVRLRVSLRHMNIHISRRY